MGAGHLKCLTSVGIIFVSCGVHAVLHAWPLQRQADVHAFLVLPTAMPLAATMLHANPLPLQEADALRQSIEEAIARLGAAVAWLSKDLPLNDRPVVTLVTAASVPPGTAAAAASSTLGSGLQGSSGGGLAAVGAAVPDDADEQIVATFPRLRQTLEVPALQPQPVPPASDGSSGKGAAGGAPAGPAEGAASPPGELAVRVWLHSPLGPAVATISEQQLRQSAAAGGAPISVVAAPHTEADEAPPPIGRDKLEVVLQFAASQPLPRSPSRYPHQGSSASTAPAAAAVQPAGTTPLHAMLAVLAVPLLSAWLQLMLSDGQPAINVLQSVAFLVSSLAAVVGIVVLQLRRPATLFPAPQVRCNADVGASSLASGGLAAMMAEHRGARSVWVTKLTAVSPRVPCPAGTACPAASLAPHPAAR